MKVYVEGGGDTRAQQAAARKAFTKLIENAGLTGRMPRVIAEGGRSNTIRRFQICAAMETDVALLVDSESRVTDGKTAAAHLAGRGEWPVNVEDARIHLMVQVMESWLLTQPEQLAEHFGRNFNAAALRVTRNVETVEKTGVYAALDRASRECPSGPYTGNKMKGFEILERMDAAPIESASAFAQRFFDFLRANCKPA